MNHIRLISPALAFGAAATQIIVRHDFSVSSLTWAVILIVGALVVVTIDRKCFKREHGSVSASEAHPRYRQLNRTLRALDGLSEARQGPADHTVHGEAVA